jgi:Na+-driven multidrug efflux pump
MGAFTIGSRVIEILGVPASALAISAAPVVGQALGAGKPDLARRAVRTSVIMFALGMLLPYALVALEGQLVARAFTNDAGVMAEAGRFFHIVPAANYFFNVLMVVMAAFHGSGHTRPVMVISLLRQWVLRIPIALLLGFALGLGSVGLYAGLAVGNSVSAILAWWVFRTGGWERPVVPTRDETPEPAPASE